MAMAASEWIAAQVVRVPTGISNCYIVGTPEIWVLIDAGTQGKAKDILQAVAEHIGPDAVPAAIVLTHGHFDHSGSARELAEKWGVQVYAHRRELPFLNGTSKYPPPDPSVGGFMSQVIRFLPNKKMNAGPNLRQMELGRLRWLPEWEVIETPGHAPGHVSFFRSSDGTLIAGDAFCTFDQNSMADTFSQRQQVAGPPPYYTCDWQAAERSVRKLAELHPKVLAAGHGIPMRGGQAAAQLRELANKFPIPEHGRYVAEPARTDENGIVHLPPPASDPVRMGAIAGLGLAAALAAGLIVRGRRQKMSARRGLERAA